MTWSDMAGHFDNSVVDAVRIVAHCTLSSVFRASCRCTSKPFFSIVWFGIFCHTTSKQRERIVTSARLP